MSASNPKNTDATGPGGFAKKERILDLVRGSSTAFTLRIIGAAAAVGVQIFVARNLGDAAFGDFSFALSIIGVLAIVARMGLGTSLLRFIGQYQASGDSGLLAGILVSSFLGVAILSGSFSFSGYLAVRHWEAYFSSGQVEALLAATLLLPPLALMGIAQAILIGFKRLGPAILAVQILRPVLLVVFLATLIGWAKKAANSGTAIYADTLAVSLTVVFLTLLVVSTTRKFSDWQHPRFNIRDWLTVSLPLMLMTGLQVLFNHTDIIMLGSLSSSADTGIYSAAARTARLVLFGLTAINSAVAPMIAESFHSGRIGSMLGVLNFASKVLLGFTSVMILILVFAGREILGLFGPGFSNAWGPMLILLSGQAINSLSGPVAYLLTMTGHQNVAARIVGVCAVLNIALNAALIPIWGIWGAAIATAISVATWNIWMLISAQRLIGINPSVFRRFK